MTKIKCPACKHSFDPPVRPNIRRAYSTREKLDLTGTQRKHGTRGTYDYGCGCDPCMNAKALAQRTYYERKKEAGTKKATRKR